MSESDLKRCPFCGGKPEERYMTSDGKVAIVCTNAKCGCRTGVYIRGSARIRWNRRYEQ